MVAVVERRGSTRRAPDWRELLLHDLCAGREGAPLRRTMRTFHRRLARTRACTDRRDERCAPRRIGYRTRAARAIVALGAGAAARPERVAQHQERIRLALDLVESIRGTGTEPVRTDRLRIALDILEHCVRQAEAMLATLDHPVDADVA